MRRSARSGQHLRDARISCDKFQIIPAGRWSRIKGTTPRGGSDEDRPHLVPVTVAGRNFVEIDATGFIGGTGLCPSEVTLDDDSKVLAYRFINVTERASVQLIDQLDEMVLAMQRSARD